MAKLKLDKGVTLVAANTEVVGDIRFSDQLYVNGHVNGNIVASGDGATVIVSEAGSVTGEIRVPNVVVNGRVEGDVYAGARVELASQARVAGNVYYRLIEMQLGAVVDGQLLHEGAAEAANVHPFPEGGSADGDASRDIAAVERG
ncbi:MAG: bactofilin family protein [Pseudomonadota bacterium]